MEYSLTMIELVKSTVELLLSCEINCDRFTCAVFVAYNYGKINTGKF